MFDTETSGLPEKGATLKELNKFPYILQLSYIFYDISTNQATVKDHYIDISNDVEITPVSFEIHKITREHLKENGKSVVYVLREFNQLLERADIVVGHNIQFDKKMIIVECMRNKITSKFVIFRGNIKLYKTEYCTMHKTKQLCNMIRYDKNNKPYFKYPKLTELYQFLYPDKELPKDLHNSLVDILLTFRCYMKVVYNVNINELNNKISALEIKYGIGTTSTTTH